MTKSQNKNYLSYINSTVYILVFTKFQPFGKTYRSRHSKVIRFLSN